MRVCFCVCVCLRVCVSVRMLCVDACGHASRPQLVAAGASQVARHRQGSVHTHAVGLGRVNG